MLNIWRFKLKLQLLASIKLTGQFRLLVIGDCARLASVKFSPCDIRIFIQLNYLLEISFAMITVMDFVNIFITYKSSTFGHELATISKWMELRVNMDQLSLIFLSKLQHKKIWRKVMQLPKQTSRQQCENKKIKDIISHIEPCRQFAYISRESLTRTKQKLKFIILEQNAELELVKESRKQE